MGTYSGSAIAVTLAGALTIYTPPATAQRVADAPPTSPDDKSEIIVTATRRNSSVNDIPSNISAVSGKQLAASGVTDIAGLTRLVPGLALFDEGARNSGNRNSFNLRGLNANAASNNDDNPDRTQDTVSVYLGESPIFFPFKLIDIDRVEVLRGPQGTLYGSGSVGGTVRFIPAKPDPRAPYYSITAQGSATKASGDPSFDFHGTANIPLSDNAAFRVSGGYERQGGWIDAVGLVQQTGTPRNPGTVVPANPADPTSGTLAAPAIKDSNSATLKFARAAVLWKPTNTLEMTLSGAYQENRAENRNEDNPFFGSGQEYLTYKAFTDPQDSRLLLGDLDVAVDLGFAKLTSTSSYSQVKVSSVSDSSGFLRTNLGAFYFGYPRLYAPIVRHQDNQTFTQEVRLVSSGNHRFDWIVGGFYLRRKSSYDILQTANGINAYTNFALATPSPVDFTDTLARGGSDQTFKEIAAFGELTWHITDKVQLTGGARVFRQTLSGTSGIPLPYASRTTEYFTDGTATNDFLLGGFVPFAYQKTNAIFKASASYKFGPHALAYATFSQGIRAGGSNSLPLIDPFGNNNSPYLTFKPDKVNNYEVGLKGTIRPVLDYAVTVFHIDWKDFQTSLYTPFAINYIANVPKTKSTGIEAQFTAHPARGVDLSVGYTYVDSKTAAPFDAIAGDDTTLISPGARLPGTSKHTLTVSGDYTLPLGNSGLKMIAHSDAAYRSTFNSNFKDQSALSTNNYYSFPSITVVNASLSIKNDAMMATLFLNNATNSRGSTIASTAAFYGARDQGYAIIRPRTLGVRLTLATR